VRAEAISALAGQRKAGGRVRFEPRGRGRTMTRRERRRPPPCPLLRRDLEVEDPATSTSTRPRRADWGSYPRAGGGERPRPCLAAAGHRVTAVTSILPCRPRPCQGGAEGVGEHVRFVEADLLDLLDQRLPDAGAYRLAILALNSLFLLAPPGRPPRCGSGRAPRPRRPGRRRHLVAGGRRPAPIRRTLCSMACGSTWRAAARSPRAGRRPTTPPPRRSR
jgi:hypothetical protein